MLHSFAHGEPTMAGNLTYRMTEQNFNKSMATALILLLPK
jgi:acyl CoA:acetate/3-ketoacid CoA transferase alpha subunit